MKTSLAYAILLTFASSTSLASQTEPSLFAPRTDYNVAVWIQALFSTDMDADGDPDLLAQHALGIGISLLPNNGDGTFARRAIVTGAISAMDVFAADLDGDGDQDLAVPDLNGLIHVMHNNGDGTVAPYVSYPIGQNPDEVIIADLDGDGDNDLAVTNIDDHSVSILFNNGDGTFAPHVEHATGLGPAFLSSDDLDGDGDNDLVVSNRLKDDVSVLLNAGDGTFPSRTDYPARDRPTDVITADLDADGDSDMVLRHFGARVVSVYLNNGDGTFGENVDYEAPNNWGGLAAVDLDSDGDADLAGAGQTKDTVSVLPNNSFAEFGCASDYAVGNAPVDTIGDDFDGDGRIDLAVSNYADNNLSVLLNTGTSQLVPVLTCSSVYTTPEPADAEYFEYFSHSGRYGIYLPDAVEIFRGVMFHLPSSQDAARHVYVNEPTGHEIRDAYYRDLGDFLRQMAEENNLALFGGKQIARPVDDGRVVDAVLEALETFAEMSGHAELAHAPIFFWGYSWGGMYTHGFMRLRPDRVIGFFMDRGAIGVIDVGDARHVPGYLMTGEFDGFIGAMKSLFRENRRLGAPWALAVELDTGHDFDPDNRPWELFRNYMTTIIDLRLPETIVPGEPIALRPIDQTSGWLADPSSFAIGTADCYGRETLEASWLPSRETARDWQRFASNGSVTEACEPTAVALDLSAPAPKAFQLEQNYPNPFNGQTRIRFALPRQEHVELIVYNLAGQKVATLVEGLKAAGIYTVSWDGRDSQGRSLASGAYLYRLRTASQHIETRKLVLLQ